MATWLGECIAERVLEGEGRSFCLRLGAPRRTRTGEWECRYEIRGLRPALRSQAFGVDALQALSLALHAVRNELERLCPGATWLDEPAFRGLPLQAPMLLPRKYEKRIEAVIERASNAFAREMKDRYDRRER